MFHPAHILNVLLAALEGIRIFGDARHKYLGTGGTLHNDSCHKGAVAKGIRRGLCVRCDKVFDFDATEQSLLCIEDAKFHIQSCIQDRNANRGRVFTLASFAFHLLTDLL